MPSVHAIILNYKRRDNVGPIVQACLDATDIEWIHVIDQADPGQRLQMLPSSSRLIATRARNVGAGRRLSYAAELFCDLVIAIDDDLFLSSKQITELVARSLEDPTRVHGVWGQLVLNVDNRPRMERGIKNVNCSVDIINRVYAFTPEHARNALRIADSLGLPLDNLGPIDDILLSFGASRRPICHDVGVLDQCTTSNQPGIAVWRQPNFDQIRIDLVKKLSARGLIRWALCEMSTKHIRTIADLVRVGAALKVECGGCGAARAVDGDEASKLGGAGNLAWLAKRIRCAGCGTQKAKLTILPPV